MSTANPSPVPSSENDEDTDLAVNAVKPVPATTGPHQAPAHLSPHTDTTGPHQGE